MKTGEGKTLVATLPAYLNALAGEGVHIVTVNDYLAKRDSGVDGQGLPLPGPDRGPHRARPRRRCSAGRPTPADITYGTNNEMGFDYLRDNMVDLQGTTWCSAAITYAIVDEVDSILIDEARTPLIISGRGEDSSEPVHPGGPLCPHPAQERGRWSWTTRWRPMSSADGDYVVDEKHKTCHPDGQRASKRPRSISRSRTWPTPRT